MWVLLVCSTLLGRVPGAGHWSPTVGASGPAARPDSTERHAAGEQDLEHYPKRPALHNCARGISEHTMAHPTVRSPILQDPQTYPDRRICICGCGRDISHKRAGAVCFDATCRSRIARDRRCGHGLECQQCSCGAQALTEVDHDGDLVCVRCGHFIAHVAKPISGFDEAKHEMRTDGDGHELTHPPKRRRLWRWRDSQPQKALAA
jgi:hypothetical protein